MYPKKLMIVALLGVPLTIWALGEEEVENIAPAEHNKRLTQQEQEAFDKRLEDLAEKHYTDKGLTRDYRIDKYKSRSNGLTNDIKRYIIDPNKLNELTEEQVASLRKRLQDRIKDEKGWFASKGLRKDLEDLLNKTNKAPTKYSPKTNLEKVSIKPKSLKDAQEQLEYVQQNIDYFSKETQTANQGIRKIEFALRSLPEEESDEPKKLSAKEIAQRTDLEDEKNMLEQNYQHYIPLLEEQEKYKKDIEDYINSQPLQDRIDLAEQQLKALENSDSKFFKQLEQNYPTTIEEMRKLKEKRPDLFEDKSINEVIAEEIQNMKETLLPSATDELTKLKIELEKNPNDISKKQETLKLEQKIKWFTLKIQIHELEGKNLLSLEAELKRLQAQFEEEKKSIEKDTTIKLKQTLLGIYQRDIPTKTKSLENLLKDYQTFNLPLYEKTNATEFIKATKSLIELLKLRIKINNLKENY